MTSDLYKTGVFSAPPPGNLSQSLPLFLGREAEILQIKKLLHEKRLVALCGVDGVGKTTLALQAAVEMPGQFKDGIFFAPLDTIISPQSVSDIIAKILGIKINQQFAPLEQFSAELSSKNILLILDGFENSPDQLLFLMQLIDCAPSLKIIITACENLLIENGAVMEIHGLPVPVRGSADAELYPSIQLFLQHTRIFPDFEPDLDSIGHICRLVDGMPFAIELASAWASTLSCERIARQIEHSLSLHPPDEISGEYQSMIAIFDATWNLFSETERRTLMSLSMFKGGFSHRAASKIAGTSPFFLDSILNKKIIRRLKSQRYALHVSFSQYLQEKMMANPVLATDVEIRHGSYYLGLLRDSEISLGHPDSMSLLDDILSDADNIHYAWKCTVAVGNLRLVQSALPTWMSILWDRGWFKDAIDALELLTIRLSEFSGDELEDALIYIQTKKSLGEFYYLAGDQQAGLRELQSGLQRINDVDHPGEDPEMHRLQGGNYSAGGRNKDSKEMYGLGLVIAEKIGNLPLVYQFINKLAVEAYLDADYLGAIPIAEHALEIARQLGNKNKIVQSLNDLGVLYYAVREYPRAKELLAEALTYLPDLKSQMLECAIFNSLGRVLTANEEYRYASQVFAQGFDLIADVNTDPWTMEMLVSASELLSGAKEKPVSLALASLLMDHPMDSTELKARVVRLHDDLTAEKIQPENRDWRLDQMSRIVWDLKFILNQKNSAQ